MARAFLVLSLLVGMLSVGALGRHLLQDAGQTIIQGQISAGDNHACSIKSDGSAWCWGANGYRRLGDGRIISSATPAEVSGLGSWLQISAGLGYHTCGLKTDSTAWCWSDITYGQLGNGATSDQQFPVAVAGGGPWLQISAGSFHICGIKTDGSAWCWGDNEYGQFGDTTLTSKSIPTFVAGGGTWVQISAGYRHTCIKTDSSAWCWVQKYNSPDQVVPTILFDSSATWLQINARAFYTCGIKSDRSLWCWGVETNSVTNDAFGFDEVHSDEVLANNSGIPTDTSEGKPWLQVSVGENLVCGITSDYSAWSWGDNEEGQIGDGTSGNTRQTPSKAYGGYSWKEVSAGYVLACGITQEEIAMCWGSNSTLGSEGPSTNIPRAVAGDGPWGQPEAPPSSTSPEEDLSSDSPSPAPSAPSFSSSSSFSTNVGAIVGVVEGGIALLAAIAAFILWRKHRSSKAPPPGPPSTETPMTIQKAKPAQKILLPLPNPYHPCPVYLHPQILSSSGLPATLQALLL